MSVLFVVLWTMVILTSVAWYGFLLFYVGIKGGREILELTRTLNDRLETDDPSPREPVEHKGQTKEKKS